MNNLSKTGEFYVNSKTSKPLGKETQEDTRKKKISRDLGMEGLTHLKGSYRSKESLDSMQSQSKLQQYLPQRRRENPKVSSQQHETLTRQRNPQENEKSRTWHTFRFQHIGRSTRYRDGTVWAPKQAHRPMQQNREPRAQLKRTWTAHFRPGSQEETAEKGESLP